MSAALAFTAVTHRPTSFALEGDGYIDEPCSSANSNVSGARHTDNVIFFDFPSAFNAATPFSVNVSAVNASTVNASVVPRTRLRLTRRGRRVIAALVALPIAIAAFAFALNGGMAVATAETSTTSFSYVTVESGQSLWNLAQALAPTADPRDVIAEIVSLNQIQGDIQPGQRLAIPASYTK